VNLPAWPGKNKDNVSIPGLRGREPKEISLKTYKIFMPCC
jgi:hypothetical protein